MVRGLCQCLNPSWRVLAQLKGIRMLVEAAVLCDDDTRLQRIVPYIMVRSPFSFIVLLEVFFFSPHTLPPLKSGPLGVNKFPGYRQRTPAVSTQFSACLNPLLSLKKKLLSAQPSTAITQVSAHPSAAIKQAVRSIHRIFWV